MYFSKEQFVVGLRLPLPSLFKQFLDFTQIPPVFLHPNTIWVLMGCNILDILLAKPFLVESLVCLHSKDELEGKV